MYCVCKKGCLMSLVIVLLILFILLGFSGNVMRASAVTRELPIYSVETTKSQIALGINCAWDDGDIDAILKTLSDYGVKATFFLAGDWCDKYPSAVKEISDAGMEIGSHANTHKDMTKLSCEEIESQINVSGEKIESITGKMPKLFRPPSGAYNNDVVSTARALGWEIIQWDCDTLDWKKVSAEQIVENGIKNLRNGSILLLHAGAQNTAEALPTLLEAIKAKNYTCVEVGKLIYAPPYIIDHAGRQHMLKEET